MEFLYTACIALVALILGVAFAPMIRGDYGHFKAYVEGRLHEVEQKAKEAAIRTINKL